MDNTTTSPSSPPTSANLEGSPKRSPIVSPEDVLNDLTTDNNNNMSGESRGEGQSGGVGVGSMTTTTIMGGSSVTMAVGGGSGGGCTVVVGDVGGGKKRKSCALKDPPKGTPTCPQCKKTFLSWKGAFGHMRKHPERSYRGFFRPPAFSSPPSSTTDLGPAPTQGYVAGEGSSDGGQEKGGSSSSPPVRGIAFDLNQPVEEAAASEEINVVDDDNKLGFDLNEFPPPNDDEEKP